MNLQAMFDLIERLEKGIGTSCKVYIHKSQQLPALCLEVHWPDGYIARWSLPLLDIQSIGDQNWFVDSFVKDMKRMYKDNVEVNRTF